MPGIDKLDKNTYKKAIQSLILVPLWDEVKTTGDCKAEETNKERLSVMSPTQPNQADLMLLKYHGSKLLKKQSITQESAVFCFSMLTGPYKHLLSGFASSSEVPSSDPKKQGKVTLIELDLSLILRMKDFQLRLGTEANYIRSQMHLKKLAIDETNTNLATGKYLKGLIKESISGVVKLLSYQKSFLLPNGDLRSGSTKEELLQQILEKAWTEFNWLKLKPEERTLAVANTSNEVQNEIEDTGACATNESATAAENVSALEESASIDSDLDDLATSTTPTPSGNSDMDIIAITPTAIPNSWKPTKTIEKQWLPVGWSCFIVYVCKFTRCTDEFVHLFVHEGKELDSSGAKNRKEAKAAKKMEKDLNREFEIVDGKGMELSKATQLAHVGAKRSADKYAACMAKTATHTKSYEMLLTEIAQKQDLLKIYVSMGEEMIPQVKQLIDDIATLEEEKEGMKKARYAAINEQDSFLHNDEIGKASDAILSKFLKR